MGEGRGGGDPPNTGGGDRPSPLMGRVSKAGRGLPLQGLVELGGTLDEHLLECRNPAPEINVRVVGHAFLPPRCTRRYASAPYATSGSAQRIG